VSAVPRVSVILAVKNGLPQVRDAVDAIRRQTFRDFELLIEDGASTDGSLEYLRSIDGIPDVSLVSKADAGVGQAFNRGFSRCRGDLVCVASADETMEPDALERAVAWFDRHPTDVCVNGAVQLIDETGALFQLFDPPHFDLLGHLANEVVLPFSGLLNRREIGADLYYDESLKTCPDYDFWIRLGMRFRAEQFAVMPEVFKQARYDRTSMTYRAETYGQFVNDKLLILERFLDGQRAGGLTDAVGRAARTGIHCWAAESLFQLEGASAAFIEQCRAAARINAWAPRLRRLSQTTNAFAIDQRTGEIRVRAA